MTLVFIISILLVMSKSQGIYGLAEPDHRRDSPIPYPIRVNSNPSQPVIEIIPSTGIQNKGPLDAMDFLRPLFTDSSQPQLPPEPVFEFSNQQTDRPLDVRQHQQFRFTFSDRDAPMDSDRRSPQDILLSALQSSNRNPTQVVSLVPTKGDSPEARLDTNAPVFTVLAHPLHQPDNLRDYAFLEDTDDHLKSAATTAKPVTATPIRPASIRAPFTTQTTTSNTIPAPPTSTTVKPRTTTNAVSSSSPTTTTPKQPTSTVKSSQVNKQKMSIDRNSQTKANANTSEMRMAPNNNALNKHHEIKRSPQQELPYTPSFRRRNTGTSNSANGNFQNFNSNSNQIFGGRGQINPSNTGISGNNAYNGGFNSNPLANNGYPNNFNFPTGNFINRNTANSGNYNPNLNNAGYLNSNLPNLNNAGYLNSNLPNGPNNYYYNPNQNVPYIPQGVPPTSQIPLVNNLPINYNLLTFYTPQIPVNFRAQQPFALNAFPLNYPVQMAPLQNVQNGVLPGYANGFPAVNGPNLNMVNLPTAGLLATSPLLATGGLPLLGLYSQPLISTIQSPMIVTQTPYVEPPPQVAPTTPYINTFGLPNAYPDLPRPNLNNDHDDHDDDNDDDDNRHNIFQNQQSPNVFPPIYFPSGFQPSGGIRPIPTHIPDSDIPQHTSNNPGIGQGSSSNLGNGGTPGLVSDSFPDFQSNGPYSSSNDPSTLDADFVDRPKKGNSNRSNTRNRNNRPATSTNFGNKINQHIPRVEPEGRSSSNKNKGGNKLLLPQNFTEPDSNETTNATTAELVLNTTVLLNTTKILFKNITDDDDNDDIDLTDDDLVNITITEPTTTSQVAQDRVSNPFINHQQQLNPYLFANQPQIFPQTFPGSLTQTRVHGYSINDPHLRHFLKDIVQPMQLPAKTPNHENARKDANGDAGLCTDLFGRKIPGCKTSRTKATAVPRTPTTSSRPKVKKSKSKPKLKSFNSQLFDIVEGGTFAEPKLPDEMQFNSYIRPPLHTIPFSQIENLILGAGTQQRHNMQAPIHDNPYVVPLLLQPMQLQQNSGRRSMIYDRHSRIIAQGHPALHRHK